MNTKNEEQIKPVIDEWQFTNSLVSLLGILAPAAFLAILLGHSGTFIDFLFNADYSKIKGHHCSKTRKKLPNIYFYNWVLNFVSRLKFRSDSKYRTGTLSPRDIWRDGSLLCNHVNMIVPGACKDPRSHRLQTPKHGQKLVYEYLDINPIFTTTELSQKSLTPTQEKNFSKYLDKIQQIINKQNNNINNMKFSTDYLARGMGLVVAQQNKKSTFYIYPIPKRYPNTSNLEILIKGPCGDNGKISIPSILHCKEKCQPSTEYKRSLYMSSKLNSISPTLQGSSFLRKLSLSTEEIRSEMDVKVKLTATRAKVSYIPQKTGIYEVSLITRGNHVVGSPYSVPVELSTLTKSCSNDTDSNSEEETIHVYKKKKVISRIVDFIDEKMLLRDDGILVKIDDETFSKHRSNQLINDKSELIPLERNPEINNTNHISFKGRLKRFPNTISETEDNCSTDQKITSLKEENQAIHYENNNISPENNANENIIHKNEEMENTITYLKNLERTNKNYLEFTTRQKYNIQNLEENNHFMTPENLNSNELCPKFQNVCSDILEIPKTNSNSTSASFTNINAEQINIKIPNDPTLEFKVQDPQKEDLKKKSRNDFRKETHVDEESLIASISTSNKDNSMVNNFVQIFDGYQDFVTKKKSSEIVEKNLDLQITNLTNGNTILAEDSDLVKCHVKTNQFNPQTEHTLRERLKKIGAILDNYDKHQCCLKNHVKNNIQKYIEETAKQNNATNKKDTVSINKLGFAEKRRQLWTEKSESSSESINVVRPSKPFKILKSSFDNTSSPSNREKSTNILILPFEGIVENNIKLFEMKQHSPETRNTKKTSFKIDIPKLNLNETIFVKNIEIVTNNEEDKIKIPSLEERKAKFLNACNKTVKPKRTQNKVSVKKSNNCTNEEEPSILEVRENETIKTASTNLEASKNYALPKEPNVSIRRKYRFKRAKLFFQSLDKPTATFQLEETPSNPKNLGQISIKTENNLDRITKEAKGNNSIYSNFKDRTKQLIHQKCLRKSNSDSEKLVLETTKSNIKIPRSESDPCVTLNNKVTPMKISERFQVTGLFRDVLEDTRFIGLPNKKAVVASLASFETNCEATVDSFNSYGETEINYFKKRIRKCNENEDLIPGFQKEFPHVPTITYCKHRSRTNPEISGLIPRRKLLSNSVENFNF